MRYLLLFSLSLLSLLACRHHRSSEESPSEAGAAFDWWMMARTYPDGRFYTERYAEALAQMRLESQLRGGGPVWESIGPHNIGGRTLCLAVSPQDTNVIWAGSASGGIWRSSTAGRGAKAWERVETGFPVLGVGALAIDPKNPQVVYAGTGEVYNLENSMPNVAIRTTRGTYGIGILKTTDGGTTWHKSLDWAYGDLRGVQDIQINPLRSATVYAATTEGLLRSYDAGKTWTNVHPHKMAVDIALHPSDTNRIFVTHGSLDDNSVSGIYRSTDGGHSFTQLGGGLPESYSGKTLLSICTTQPQIMYASVGNAFSQEGLYRSSDGGTTWTKASGQNVCTYQGWYSHDVSVHPSIPTQISWVGIDAWTSSNSASTVTQRSYWYKWYFGYLPAGSREGPDDYMHADIHQICRTPGAPDKIYYATDGGIFVSYDGGKTFAGRNGGYQTQQFYANLGSSSLSPQLCIGGMQDNSTAIYSGDLSWKRVLGGDGECAAIMPGNDQVMFGSSQYLNMYRSDDGGESFFSISPPEAFDEDAAFNGPFEISPADPKALYAGAGSLFFSDDLGNTWSNMSAGPVSPGHVILTIAPHPTNKYAAYFSTAPLTDGGQAQVYRFDFWNSVLEPLSGLPDRLCMDLAISTLDTSLIYAVFGGFGTPHVYRSRDAGNTWTAASEGLPDVPTNSIQIDPENPDYLYVGNDLGVWQSKNAGQNWEYYSAGAPQAMLAMHLNVTPSRVLRVATYGLGVWQTQLPPVASVQEGQSPVTGLRISPNPAQEVLHASFEIRQTQRVVLDILDLSGRVLITQPAGLLSAGAQQVRVPVGHLPAGCYGLRLRAGGTHTGQVWMKK